MLWVFLAHRDVWRDHPDEILTCFSGTTPETLQSSPEIIQTALKTSNPRVWASLTEKACLITSVTYRIAEPVFKLVSVVAVVHGHSLALNAQQLLEEQDRFLVISSPEKVWSQPKNNHISHAGLGWGSPGRVNVYVRVCVCEMMVFVWVCGVWDPSVRMGPEQSVKQSFSKHDTLSDHIEQHVCQQHFFSFSFKQQALLMLLSHKWFYYYLIYEFLPPL